jgi:hypothetical protein
MEFFLSRSSVHCSITSISCVAHEGPFLNQRWCFVKKLPSPFGERGHNKSMEDSKLPHRWKSANITPIHKKGPTHTVSNYRLITTIDGRNLIFGHKLHIGTSYRGKRFWTHQIPTSCLPILLIFIHIWKIVNYHIDGNLQI